MYDQGLSYRGSTKVGGPGKGEKGMPYILLYKLSITPWVFTRPFSSPAYRKREQVSPLVTTGAWSSKLKAYN